jgi:hypothetical protein
LPGGKFSFLNSSNVKNRKQTKYAQILLGDGAEVIQKGDKNGVNSDGAEYA